MEQDGRESNDFAKNLERERRMAARETVEGEECGMTRCLDFRFTLHERKTCPGVIDAAGLGEQWHC